MKFLLYENETWNLIKNALLENEGVCKFFSAVTVFALEEN